MAACTTLPAPITSETLREADTGTEQRCSRCHEWWPLEPEFFHADKANPTGRARWCRACCAEVKNERRLHLASAGGQPAALMQGLPC